MSDDHDRKYGAAMGQLADQIQASVGAGPDVYKRQDRHSPIHIEDQAK